MSFNASFGMNNFIIQNDLDYKSRFFFVFCFMTSDGKKGNKKMQKGKNLRKKTKESMFKGADKEGMYCFLHLHNLMSIPPSHHHLY